MYLRYYKDALRKYRFPIPRSGASGWALRCQLATMTNAPGNCAKDDGRPPFDVAQPLTGHVRSPLEQKDDQDNPFGDVVHQDEQDCGMYDVRQSHQSSGEKGRSTS